MKKIITCILLLLAIGCSNDEIIDNNVQNQTLEKKDEEIQEIEEMKEPEYIDDNPIIVGLYNNGKLVTDYNTKFKDKKDIATFNIVFTNEENLGSTNIKNNWNKYYKMYQNIDDYKIGFYFTFMVGDEKYENLMLDPSTQHKLHPYLYAYLYDGVHSSGKYTHLTMKDLKDNTIFSSIKLYLHQQTKDITSPIILTVFTYKDENDFINGYYRGNSKYTITINNK